MFEWLKEKAKKFWNRLTESQEEIERRVREQRRAELTAKAKANERQTIQAAQERMRNLQKKRKGTNPEVLKLRTHFTSFEEFYRQYGSRWREIAKGGVLSKEEMDAVYERIKIMVEKDPAFAEQYAEWAQKLGNKEVKVKSVATVQNNHSRRGGYTI